MEAQHDQEINGSFEKGPSSSSSALKVKLKYEDVFKEVDENKNNVVRGGDGDVFKEAENNVREEKIFLAKQKKDHICCECGKEFSSGKALGGHMSSAHVQTNQRLEESWKKKKNFTQENSSKLVKRSRIFEDEEEEEGFFNNNEQNIICDICGKKFPSKKSLFGHMRCHPDRDWRGMKPPTSKKNTKYGFFRANFQDDNHNDDDDDDDAADDDRFAIIRDEEERSIDINVVPPPLTGELKDCLNGWGVTDRRGRSPLKKRNLSCNPNRSKSISSSDEKELHDAVHQLIRLINGDNNNININNNNNSEVMCSSNSVGTTTPKEVPLNSLKNKSKRKAVFDEAEEENCGECSSPVHKKRRLEKQLNKLEPSKDVMSLGPSPSPIIKKTSEVKYKCNICDKTFTSYQALGGHRSSHNKFKITIENTIDHHQEIKARNQGGVTHAHDHNAQLGEEINNFNIIEHGSNNVHKCKICDKIFPTGQALGGHQKSHWNNNQDESSSQNASKVLDFDLNELPDVDDCYR